MKLSALKSAMLPISGGVVALIAVIVALNSGKPVSQQEAKVSEVLKQDVRFNDAADLSDVEIVAPIWVAEKDASQSVPLIAEAGGNVQNEADVRSSFVENEKQQPVVLAKNVFPEPQPWISRTGNLEGSVLSGAGSRVVVVASKQEPGAAGIGLELLVEDVRGVNEGLTDPAHHDEDVAADAESIATNQPSSQWNRLSHEEELFRAKWGWNAFNEVQKVLREESD